MTISRFHPFRRATWLLLVAAFTACATKSDVDTLRGELAGLRATQDTLQNRLSDLETRLLAALDDQRSSVQRARGDLGRQLDGIERQLVQIQELLGQSQMVLRRLREGTEAGEQERATTPESATSASTDTATEGGVPMPADGGPGALYKAAMEQLRRGALSTARAGFNELLVDHPADPLAPDAQLQIAETYREEDDAGRALREYNRVVELYPNSEAAPTALYKAGLVEVERGNKDSACAYLTRVLAGYPRSDESRLARDQAERLSCR